MRNFYLNGLIVGLIALLSACNSSSEIQQPTSITGLWEAAITANDQQIPFQFEVKEEGNQKKLYLINGAEKIEVEDIEITGDSVKIGLHIFNTAIHAKASNNTLSGYWTKKDYQDYVLPFAATKVEAFSLPANLASPAANISGKWAVTFDGENGEKEPAVGVFKQDGQKLTGTFLTPTGDYRYLSGYINGNQFMLSCFDGEHAFLFKGTAEGEQISEGHFWSGKSWHQTWAATKDENASLPNPEELTYLKEGYDKIDFSFPNLQGESVSLEDERFKDKVVIVQLMGSWCPNCMDETAFLAPYYEENKDKGLEIVALAFERSPDPDKAIARLEKLKKRFNINYEILIAGSSSKDEAAEKLPMLNHVMSFPTTIFIDKKGVVRKIHTGFAGPGTGVYYEKFVEEFKLFMDKLLAES